jgi:arsenate reductase
MSRHLRNACCASFLALVGMIGPGVHAAEPSDVRDAGAFVRALWLVQRYGTVEAADPRNDLRTKGALAKALGKDGALTFPGVNSPMDPETFAKLAGPDARLDPSEARQALEADLPATRRRLLPPVAAHAEFLSTTFDMIDEPHRAAGEQLVAWIVARHQPGRALPITFVCTGNSRRSILGATMGNVAAAYYGLPEVRCYSGGTAPTAFNSRTVATLEAIGIAIEPMGREAARGEPETSNPIYRVRWGQAGVSGEPMLESTEFSKLYGDASNPQGGFAALMVCGEADASCPFVKGASSRVSMPYLDPKIYDGSAYESAKYAERRDDMGRLMMAVMMQARHRLAAAGKLHQTRSEAPR